MPRRRVQRGARVRPHGRQGAGARTWTSTASRSPARPPPARRSCSTRRSRTSRRCRSSAAASRRTSCSRIARISTRRRPRRPTRSSSTRARCVRRARACWCEDSIKDAMLEKIAAVGRAMMPGDPLDPATKLGAIVDETQMKRVLVVHRCRQERRREGGAGRQARARGQRRILRRADGVRRREADDAHRARGNLRARAGDDHVQERRGGHPDRERRGLRSRGRRLDARHQHRASHGARVARRHGVRELLRRRRHHRALRRLQAIGHRPRQVAARVRQVHRAQDHLDRPRAEIRPTSPVAFVDIETTGVLPRPAPRHRRRGDRRDR